MRGGGAKSLREVTVQRKNVRVTRWMGVCGDRNLWIVARRILQKEKQFMDFSSRTERQTNNCNFIISQFKRGRKKDPHAIFSHEWRVVSCLS